MTTVYNNGAPIGGLVTAQLLLSSTSTGARSLLGQANATVDASGRWQLDLTPNIQEKPAGSFWEIVEPTAVGDPNVYDVNVPAASATRSAWPVTALPAVTSTATRPVVTGSKGGNAALTSLIAALKALGLIADTTT